MSNEQRQMRLALSWMRRDANDTRLCGDDKKFLFGYAHGFLGAAESTALQNGTLDRVEWLSIQNEMTFLGRYARGLA